MKDIQIKNVTNTDLTKGEFNNCEHVCMQVEPGKYQTISCRLPNGKFVTFGFVPGVGDEMECVDIHSTVGKHWTDKNTVGELHFVQHLIGFAPGCDTFDTRLMKKPTSLATLLLNKLHYEP
jgi:hypothetical protein